ncbi:MAG: TerD family protein [Oligoflexales bacterium]
MFDRLFILLMFLLFGTSNLSAGINLAADSLEDYLGSIASRSLAPGETFKIDKRINKIVIGFGWDPESQSDYIDMDLNLHLIKRNRHLSKIIWHDNHKYQTKICSHKHGLIFHSGDSVTGEGEGDDEAISIFLGGINKHKKEISHLVATVVSYSGQSLQAINNSFCRILAETASGYTQELARYSIGGVNDPLVLEDQQAVILFSISKNNEQWTIKAIGKGVDSVKGHSMVLATDCQDRIKDLLQNNELN